MEQVGNYGYFTGIPVVGAPVFGRSSAGQREASQRIEDAGKYNFHDPSRTERINFAVSDRICFLFVFLARTELMFKKNLSKASRLPFSSVRTSVHDY